jgi:hypothetical protein
MPKELIQFDWVAECDHRTCGAEVVQLAALQLVQELWVSLLKEGPSMTTRELAREIATVEEIQSYFEAGKLRKAITEVTSLVNLRAERAMARTFRRLRVD